MLQCKNIQKKYMHTTALADISIDIEPGKIYALLGPNGNGKTTFMKIATGLVKPTSGTITYDNEPIGEASKAAIAYMPTEGYFYPYMTIKDAGNYYNDFFEDFDPARFDRLLGKMDLNQRLKIRTLSSGMMAKLKLAITLSRNAKLYLLDEPLNGIDLVARDLVIESILETANDKNTFIISSHLVDELEKIIDSAIFIKDGSVILSGSAEELRETNKKSIADLYRSVYI